MGKFDGSDDLTIFNSQKILLGTGLHFNDGKITVNDSYLTNHIQNIFLIYILMNILKIMLIVCIKLIKVATLN